MKCPKCGLTLPDDSKFCQYCGYKLGIAPVTESFDIKVPENPQFAGKTCPFCKAPFLKGEAIVICNHCEMPHHLDCWKENGGCTTFGCTGNIGKIVGGEQKDQQQAPVAVRNHATPSAPATIPYPTGKTAQSTQKNAVPKPEDRAVQEKDVILAENNDRIIQGTIPVLLEKTVIQKRSDGKLYASCSFVPLADKRIQAISVDVLCADIWREPLQSVNGYQYLDLRTSRDTPFGETEKIPLPDPNTRVIDVVIQKIMFSDGTMIKQGGKTQKCSNRVSLSHFLNDELLAEYKAQTYQNVIYFPVNHGTIWACTCGAINREEEENCHLCGDSFALLSSHLDKDKLQQSVDEKKRIQEEKEEQARRKREEAMRLKREKEERERKEAEERLRVQREIEEAEAAERARIAKEQEEKRKAKNKKTAIVSGIAATVVLLVYLVGWQLVPSVRYKNADTAFAAGDFEAAYQGFLKTGGYRDGGERATETRYVQGEKAFESKDYDLAVTYFSEISGYKDSEKRANYAKAMSLYERGKYEEAAKLFEVAKIFSSAEYTRRAYYYYAKELIEQGKLHEAYIILAENVNTTRPLLFEDSIDLANSAEYQFATESLNSENYENAYYSFGNIKEYEDSGDLYLQAGYQYGLQLFEKKSYEKAASVFESLGSFKDSEKQANESVYQHALGLRKVGLYKKAAKLFTDLGDYSDSAKQAKENKYQWALSLQKQKKYAEAEELFAELGSYSDSSTQLKETRYLYAESLAAKGRYTEAVPVFKDLGSYKDSKEKWKSTMWAFVNEHENNNNTTTYEYLTVLKSYNYESSKWLYESLYKWTATILINGSLSDYSSSKSQFTSYDTIYCHMTLSGGPPGEKTTIKAVATYPNGSTATVRWDKDEMWVRNERGTAYFWFTYPESAKSGSFKVVFYAGSAQIGQATVRII